MTNENLATQIRNREVHGSRINYSEPNEKEKCIICHVETEERKIHPLGNRETYTFKVADNFAMLVI